MKRELLQPVEVKRECFTLIELLVVIAIIAILAAILLPALNSARERGIGISCVAQLNSVGKGIMQYRSDFNDYLVSHNGTDASVGKYMWSENLGRLKYLGGEEPELFMCPASVGRQEAEYSAGYGATTYFAPDADRGYAINFKMRLVNKFGQSRLMMIVDSGMWKEGKKGHSHFRINRIGNDENFAQLYLRHNGMGNVLLADGHVQTGSKGELEELGTLEWSSDKWVIGPQRVMVTGPFGSATATTAIGNVFLWHDGNI